MDTCNSAHPKNGFALTSYETFKAGTQEKACFRSTFLQHATGAKLPRLHQRFLAKKYVAQQNFCSRVLLPHIKVVWYEGASSRGKSVAWVCFRSKLPGVYWNLLAVKWRVSSWPIKLAYVFHHNYFPCPNRVVSSFSSLVVSFVCAGWGTYPRACFRSRLPRMYRLLESSLLLFKGTFHLRGRPSGKNSYAPVSMKPQQTIYQKKA